MNPSQQEIPNIPGIQQEALTTTRKEVSQSTSLIVSEAEELIISSAEEYREADAIRDRIKQTEKAIDDKIEPIIRPIRKGLDALYALNRELRSPLQTALEIVNGKMKGWQLAERQRVQREEEERRRREEEIQKRKEEEARVKRAEELEERARRIAESDPQNADRLLDTAEKLLLGQDVPEEPVYVPQVTYRNPTFQPRTRALNSSASDVKKWRLIDKMLLLKGIVAGTIPLDAVTIDQVYINRRFRASAKEVGEWTGIEVYDDVNIASKGGRR